MWYEYYGYITYFYHRYFDIDFSPDYLESNSIGDK